MRQHILFVIPSLQGGGAERVVTNLLRHIDRTKFQLSLAVVDSRDSVFRADVPEDVKFFDLSCVRVRYAMPKIIKLIWKLRPNIVFSTLGHLNLALAICRPLMPNGVTYIARESVVVSMLPQGYKHPSWWNWAYRRFICRFDMIICQSLDMQIDLVNNFNLSEYKTVVINNPVDTFRINQLIHDSDHCDNISKNIVNRDFVQLVAAGRLTHQKGFDLLINAIALCGGGRFRLLLLGDGEIGDELRLLAIQCGVADQISFVGFQKNPYPFFAQADAFVLSSRFEGFPNVVLEALACGTPVIATPAPGGVREILGELTGCVIAESISVDSLAKALSNFVVGSRVLPEVVAPYSAESITKRYECIFLKFAN